MTWVQIVDIPKTLSGKKYLHLAAETGQSMIFKTMFESEEDKDPRTAGGQTLFHLACFYGHTDIAEILLSFFPAL